MQLKETFKGLQFVKCTKTPDGRFTEQKRTVAPDFELFINYSRFVLDAAKRAPGRVFVHFNSLYTSVEIYDENGAPVAYHVLSKIIEWN